jgi:glycine hydroxymethyltransferase
MLIDLRARGITGKQAEQALDAAGITCNKNAVPDDPQPPMVTSGIRLGTAAVTTRGMGEEEMRYIAELIDRVLTNLGNESVYAAVRAEVAELCRRFPLYPELEPAVAPLEAP